MTGEGFINPRSSVSRKRKIGNLGSLVQTCGSVTSTLGFGSAIRFMPITVVAGVMYNTIDYWVHDKETDDIRVGVYSDNPAGSAPLDLLADSGVITNASVNSPTQFNSIGVAPFVCPSTRVWIATRQSSTNFIWAGTTSAIPFNRWSEAGAWGAFPDQATPVDDGSNVVIRERLKWL